MKLHFRTFLAILLVLIGSLQALSQTTGKKKFPDPKKEEEAKESKEAKEDKGAKEDKEASKFGWGVNLGNLAFAGSAFEFGIAPNIAYKLDEALAVGFMLKLNYYYEKYQGYDLKYSAFDFGPTVFTRWKPLMKMEGATPFMQGLFIQADYERAYVARPAYDEFGNLILNDNGTSIKSERVGEDYLYIGIGAASGYPLSTFFSFHYNIIDDVSLSRTPFDYRIGFTYNY